MKIILIVFFIFSFCILKAQEKNENFFIDNFHGIAINNSNNFTFKYSEYNKDFLHVSQNGDKIFTLKFQSSTPSNPEHIYKNYFYYVATNPGNPMVAADGPDGSTVSSVDSLNEFFSDTGLRTFERYEVINDIKYVMSGDQRIKTKGDKDGQRIGPVLWVDISQKQFPYYLKIEYTFKWSINFVEKEDLFKFLNSIYIIEYTE